jgi:DMSO/TMAO reductase YedYZ molybdopterin-dependent catalytic subunit
MEQKSANNYFPTVGDGSGLAQTEGLYKEELQLALRNRGMPLEALRYPITPTGLHYLLIHYDIPEVNVDQWRLRVAGLVAKPLELTLEQIKKRPRRTLPVTMECAGNGRALFAPRRISQPWLLEAIGTAEWTGTPLRSILLDAGVSADAAEIVFTGLDRGVEGDEIQVYQRSLSVDEATRDEVLLAYEMNGEPLPPQHGYPLRLVMPGWYGMASVKWLERIEAIDGAFDGVQQALSYHFRSVAGEKGVPCTRMRVNSLMVPPGIPDYFGRRRTVEAGPVEIFGRAWSGEGKVKRVEFAVDGAWQDAKLEDAAGPHAWRRWTVRWRAVHGTHELRCRATDAGGAVQPLEPPWDVTGFGNNAAQKVEVVVR